MPNLITTLLNNTRRLAPLAAESVGSAILRRAFKDLASLGADAFLEILLAGMDWAFMFSRGYRKNIAGFEGRYLFQTQDRKVRVGVVFHNDQMKVLAQGTDHYDVMVSFKDTRALWNLINSGSLDILESVLDNDLETDGNLNYIFKFGFMVGDLLHRIGITPG